MARELMLVTRAALIPFPAGCQVAQIRSPTSFLLAHVGELRGVSVLVQVLFQPHVEVSWPKHLSCPIAQRAMQNNLRLAWRSRAVGFSGAASSFAVARGTPAQSTPAPSASLAPTRFSGWREAHAHAQGWREVHAPQP